VDVVPADADVVGRRGPGELDLAGGRLGEGEVARRGGRLRVTRGRPVHLELADLPGRPAGVRGDVQPHEPRGGGRQVDGDRAAGGRVERVPRGGDQVGEARAIRTALHHKGFRARGPVRHRY